MLRSNRFPFALSFVLSSSIALVAAGCDKKPEGGAAPAPASAPATAPAATTIKVGCALSLTGPAASYGAQQKAGLAAAVDEVNAAGGIPKLELVIEDDASTKEQGIAVFQKLINRDKVAVIIGPTLSNTASAADPIAQQAGVTVIGVSNTAAKGITDIGDHVWRDSLTEAQVIPGAFKKAQSKLGFKTAGIFYGNDDVFTKSGYDVMNQVLTELGVKIIGTPQTFAKADRDYHAQITALIDSKPDVIVVSALADNASGIVSQARQQGWTGPILGGNGFNSPAFIKNAGPAADGVLVGTAWDSTSQSASNQKFLATLAKANVNPDQFSAQAYTSIYILAEAVKQSGGKGGRDDINAGLAKVKDLETPLGKFSFTPGRDASHEPSVQIVKDGKFQIYK